MAHVSDQVIYILDDAAVASYSRASLLPESTLLLARKIQLAMHGKLYQYIIFSPHRLQLCYSVLVNISY